MEISKTLYVTSREEWRAWLTKHYQSWANLSEGCYVLRSNVNTWTAEELWTAYIQLTDAEAAFRLHKSDLKLRPVWHQKKIACKRIFSFASWRMSYGSVLAKCASKLVWVMNHAKSFKRSRSSN